MKKKTLLPKIKWKEFFFHEEIFPSHLNATRLVDMNLFRKIRIIISLQFGIFVSLFISNCLVPILMIFLLVARMFVASRTQEFIQPIHYDQLKIQLKNKNCNPRSSNELIKIIDLQEYSNLNIFWLLQVASNLCANWMHHAFHGD